MGFLSGVLNEVKNDPSVTTYYKDMETTLKTIKNSMHKSGGLSAAVEAVSQALGTWDREVEKRTGDVKRRLGELKNKTIPNKIDEINSVKHKGLKAMHEAFKISVVEISEDMWTVRNNQLGYNGLDENLKNKLSAPLAKIDGALKVLKKSSQNKFLAEQAKTVDDTLSKEEKQLMTAIEEQYLAVKRISEDELWKIRHGVNSLLKTRKHQIDHLNSAVSEANKFVERQLGIAEISIRNQIYDKIGDIRKQVNNLHTGLANNKFDLFHLVVSAQEAFDAIKNQVVDEKGEKGVLHENWPKLQAEIQRLVKNIYHKEATAVPTGNIGEVVKHVGEYAKRFKSGTQGFEKTVKEWINDIYLGNGVVQHWIWEYVGDNKDYGVKFNKTYFDVDAEEVKSETSYNIAEAIRTAIGKDVVEEAAASFNEQGRKSDNDDEIATNITGVQSVCDMFVSKLQRKIKESGIVAKIANAIETLVKETGDSTNDNLHTAVDALLAALQSKANQVTEEIELFTGITNDGDDEAYNIGTNLKEAIVAVDEIRKQFQNKNTALSLTDFGPQITAALSMVQPKIQSLYGLLSTSSDEGEIQKKIAAIEEDIRGLDSICKNDSEHGKIKKTQKEMDELMIDFKDRLLSKLNYITHYVDIADTALEKEISSVDAALSHAYDAINKSISELYTNLTQQVSDAFHKLTKEIRLSFCTHKVAELQVFKKLIGTELEMVKGIIDNDVANGVKGFLVKFNGFVISTLQCSSIFRDTKMGDLAGKVQANLDTFLGYVMNQTDMFGDDISKLKKADPTDEQIQNTFPPMLHKMMSISQAVEILLSNLSTSQHYNHEFCTNLSTLRSALTNLTPTKFGDTSSPIFQSLKDGFEGLVAQLEKAYVSKYSGAPAIDEWTTVKADSKETELTTNGRYGAKVCVTSIYMLFNKLHKLFYYCAKDWCKQKVQGEKDQMNLEQHLVKSGYDIANLRTTKNGWDVAVKLGKGFDKHSEFNKEPQQKIPYHLYLRLLKNSNDSNTVMLRLFNYLETYYNVAHLRNIENSTTPRSICDMLQWLCGLKYHPMCGNVTRQLGSVFPTPPKYANEEFTHNRAYEYEMEATQSFSAGNLSDTLGEVCEQSYDILNCILGHGHDGGVYASDFKTNARNLSYPSSAGQCFDLLFEILCRVHQQLNFVRAQVSNGPQSGGWSDCWYGNGVGGSNWNCNALQCPNQNTDQEHNQTCNQKCDQKAECGLKSPLQSFLEDGLPGFMPHPFTKPNCKITCDLSNHRGKPCKTPMGFVDIATVASHRKTGAHLKRPLEKFCGYQPSALSKLIARLNCLLGTTPQTLGDLFGFFSNFLYHWNHNGQKHKRDAFKDAVEAAYFGAPYEINIASIQSSSHHKNKSGGDNHLNGDIFTLYNCNYASNVPVYPCGRYMQTVTADVTCVFSSRNADKYLSWISYLTETFYDLLKQLYEEFCNNCNKKGRQCYDKGCVAECQLKTAYQPGEPLDDFKGKYHTDNCTSMAQCKLALPTLSKYGFHFESPYNLSGAGGLGNKRTCKDFCAALKNIIDENNVLFTLAYKTIPNFLWAIREPFIWLTVALWSLSLFYLICVMVGRLDVLHIRSHLRIPSSHKITAQSLLAAAQVGRLAKISYLQP